RVRRCSGSTPFSHRGRCSYTQTGILLHPNRNSPRTVGAPAPGAKVFWLDSPFAPRAVLLHLNRDSPASKPGFPSNRRSTRPGCEGALARLPFRTEGGAPTPKPGSHRGRCSYIQTGILLHPNRNSPRTVGAPAPG